MTVKTKILITGATGHVGSVLVEDLKNRYELVLTDNRQPANAHALPFIKVDITDRAAMRTACEKVDIVLHLAADPRIDAPWESVLPNNVIGAYNIFQAAHEAGCRRIIFASSINAVCGYPTKVRITTDAPVRPPNLYGVSKVWGEALARFYADTTGLSCICLRFGWVVSADDARIRPGNAGLHYILTHGDLVRLIVASIEAPAELRFGVFHGVSNNRRTQFDLSDTRKTLGYEPQDDAFILAELATDSEKHFYWQRIIAWLKKHI
jgi:nucleoside-diphosphate-sugar epimerase